MPKRILIRFAVGVGINDSDVVGGLEHAVFVRYIWNTRPNWAQKRIQTTWGFKVGREVNILRLVALVPTSIPIPFNACDDAKCPEAFRYISRIFPKYKIDIWKL